MKKNFLITFIIAIISIIPIYDVKALTGYDNNTYPDLPTGNNTTSHYAIIKDNKDRTVLVYYEDSSLTTYDNKKNYLKVSGTDYVSYGGFTEAFSSRSVYVYYLNEEKNIWEFYKKDVLGVRGKTPVSSFTNDISNNLNIFENYVYQDIIYSNVNFYYWYQYKTISIFEYKKSYMYYQTKTLNNSYVFTFTTNNYNSNYKYQIKFNNNSWLDISKALSNNGHSHTIKENGTLYMQILNENNDVIFSKNILINSIKSNPIEYTAEKLKTNDGNLDYYKFHIFTSNYNSEYRYMYKFSDTLAFKDISMYLDDEDGYDIQLYSNDTLYLAVYDLSNNLIYSTTYTVTDLYDNVSTPTADIEVGYTTNENNLSQANIHFKFYNYDTSYKYQYSYNNQDFVDIDYLDIKNKEYTLVKYTNCHIYFRILDLNDNVIFTKSVSVDGILYDNYNKYVLTIDDLYSKETKKIIYHTFYYQNIVDRENEPMIIFTYEGSQSLNFYLNINEQVTNLKSYMLNLKNNIFTSDISDYTVLPYEYKGNNPLIANYDSYTAFAFLPFLDLDTFVYGTDYTDFRLIIYSNIELNFNSTGNFDGALVPTDGSPILDTNFKTQFKIFSDIFNKAIKRFWTVLVEIIQNVTLFFDGLSPILHDFYIVIFALVLFIFIMKFIL